MSNRILGFVILALFFSFIYGFYLIFFVKYTGTLEITSNVNNYSVSLHAKKIYNTTDYDCITKVCTLKEISPFDYTITLSSPTYKEIVQELSLKGKKTNHIKVTFIKDTKLTQIKDTKEIKELTLSTKQLAEQKIEEIKLKKESTYIKNLGKLGFFYFRIAGNNLNLFRSFEGKETKLGSFPKVEFDQIEIQQIQDKTDKIFFSLKDRKYIYNLDVKKIDDLKLVPKVKYIKQGDFLTNYLIVTDIGTYTYDELSKELKYFYLFKDFVHSKDSYIGVIYKDEINKFKNFSIKNNQKNLIISYNPSTLERNVLLETDTDIEKININNAGKIYFYDKSGIKYELENF